MTKGLYKVRLKKKGHLGMYGIEKLVSVCSKAVSSRSERNVGAHVDNRPSTLMTSIDIQ